MEYTRALVTGGSGFIAGHLQEALLRMGVEVISIDAMPIESTIKGNRLLSSNNFHFTRANVNDLHALNDLCDGVDIIFHMASNTDVRSGSSDSSIDYINTFSSTRSVLEAMRTNDISKLFFPSSSAVYGMREGMLREDEGDLRPISYYGAYKLACESIISSYCSMNGMDALVFRLPNVVGPGITHGVIHDLIEKIRLNSQRLKILGNGRQSKQYLHVNDAIDAMIGFSSDMNKGLDIYNISTDTSISVDSIARMICDYLGVNPLFEYTGGNSGWRGDVPSFSLNSSKARARGWKYTLDSMDAVEKTIENLCYTYKCRRYCH